jgi:hypothetical protein
METSRMAIIVAEEEVFPLSEVPNRTPRRHGKKIHIATVFRWKDGLRGVRLETIRIGGTLHTSAQSLQRFFEALSATDAKPAHQLIRTPANRARAITKAERELDRLGVSDRRGKP